MKRLFVISLMFAASLTACSTAAVNPELQEMSEQAAKSDARTTAIQSYWNDTQREVLSGSAWQVLYFDHEAGKKLIADNPNITGTLSILVYEGKQETELRFGFCNGHVFIFDGVARLRHNPQNQLLFPTPTILYCDVRGGFDGVLSQMISRINQYELTGDENLLTFFDETGREIARFKRADSGEQGAGQ